MGKAYEKHLILRAKNDKDLLAYHIHRDTSQGNEMAIRLMKQTGHKSYHAGAFEKAAEIVMERSGE